MSMPGCPKCGAFLGPDSDRCPRCGALVPSFGVRKFVGTVGMVVGAFDGGVLGYFTARHNQESLTATTLL